jgi:hypothetical protein
MTITMNDDTLVSVAQLEEFANLTKTAKFKSNDKNETYQWVDKTLGKFQYHRETKKNKGIIKKYIVNMTGYSESAIDKMIARKKKIGKVFLKERTQNEFQTFYTREDTALLAEVVNAYRGQNGVAIKKVLCEMFEIYEDTRFERLSHLSVSHLYNLKKRVVYKTHSLTFTKTNPVNVDIGVRAKPEPNGKPGYLRVDSVHQGDFEKQKGVYYIHFVDEVTQWDVVVCVEHISEYFLERALEEAFAQFPFGIINFHSDNGSEYINKTVSKILKKAYIKQTKSRSRHSNDNALAEGKNASTLRKQMGHIHIPQKFAPTINEFCFSYLNPFLAFHRPCAFATNIVNAKGKIKKIYKKEDYQTPVDKLLAVPDVEKFLKNGVTIEALREQKLEKSHFEVAKEVSKARVKLFNEIKTKN